MRLPAVPLITNDPYLSLWCAADRLTDVDATHWAGARKRVRGAATIDGESFRFLGCGKEPAMETRSLDVTATSTASVLATDKVELKVRFTSPLLPEDMDLMSVPITMITMEARALDGQRHEVSLTLEAYDDLCYDGTERPSMQHGAFSLNGLNVARMGQRRQKILCSSADHITIDWGFLYLASRGETRYETDRLCASTTMTVQEAAQRFTVLVGYDDIASINYFGVPSKAWYARGGKTLCDALVDFDRNGADILARCAAMDEKVAQEAERRGGADYALICAAAFRQCIAAHKLIADEKGRPVLLSKENDSNGCIGTVDVSYPSTPLFLKYNPELVSALCRPILRFAHMPVWSFDYAPHDVGRYPNATGQVYAARPVDDPEGEVREGDWHPDWYLWPSGEEIYDERYQMPVEECGNMLIMLYAAMHFDKRLAPEQEDMPILDKWVQYLLRFGEDPGNQLCTDDFAGHLAHNVNLAAKAMVGVACYGRILAAMNDERADGFIEKAKQMAASWLERAKSGDHTALTFDDPKGWSMKYNLAWGKVLGLGLLDEGFYEEELRSYLPHMNRYGLPLDSRRSYTKSDWILWTAAMADDREVFDAIIRPVADYLRESATRVPFSDWYDTITGRYEHFIARSVQGGIFMPLL